ncbi:MAG TPA: cytochrome c-type biogenesis protein CcmH [Longimicrobium sp.]|jgi:cytochrome c-type biogenesis protein CcmH/NrfF|uniref:cytochrome c-type biogenesis protein CcmH n=1 Tax=Longimicrobium sp. TaxID=2029185 RepID=UPI002ED84DDC
MHAITRGALALAAALCASTLAAQVPTPETERIAVEAIAELKSPFGPHMLDMCPNEQADELRQKLHMAAARGAGKEQLIGLVVSQYGENMRALPERRGFGLWAWLLPPAGLAAGAAFLWGRLRQMRGGAPSLAAAGPALSADEQASLNDALRDLEREDDE